MSLNGYVNPSHLQSTGRPYTELRPGVTSPTHLLNALLVITSRLV